MKYIYCLAILLIAFSCNETSDKVNNNLTATQTTDTRLADSLILEVPSGAVGEISFPKPLVDDPCLPYPNNEFLHYLGSDSLLFVYSQEYNLLFNYVVAHFDSIAPRKTFNVEDEFGNGNYHWEQEFSNGIIYNEQFGGEGGASATIGTKCTDRMAIYSTLNAILNYGRIVPEDEYDDHGIWNSDSMEFGPADGGAGCYYTILKNDSTGFYYINNYCGC